MSRGHVRRAAGDEWKLSDTGRYWHLHTSAGTQRLMIAVDVIQSRPRAEVDAMIAERCHVPLPDEAFIDQERS